MCANFFQLSAALQEHKTGTYQRQIFSFETYRDVHVVVEKVIMDIEGDRYHYSKCRRFWRQWARTAMYDFDSCCRIYFVTNTPLGK